MYKDKLFARLMDMGIKVFSILGNYTSRSREYDFTMNNIPSNKCKLLDVGSVGSLFPLNLAKKGYEVYVVDVRKYHEKHPNLISINSDITNTSFSNDFFNVITCISTIEHIGLSAYGDPNYGEGDKLAVKEFSRILEKPGKLILTTPFTGEYKVLPFKNTYEKIYDYETIRSLFRGWNILKEEYYIPKGVKNWIKATKEEAEKEYVVYPKSNLSCYVLEQCG